MSSPCVALRSWYCSLTAEQRDFVQRTVDTLSPQFYLDGDRFASLGMVRKESRDLDAHRDRVFALANRIKLSPFNKVYEPLDGSSVGRTLLHPYKRVASARVNLIQFLRGVQILRANPILCICNDDSDCGDEAAHCDLTTGNSCSTPYLLACGAGGDEACTVGDCHIDNFRKN